MAVAFLAYIFVADIMGLTSMKVTYLVPKATEFG